MDLFQTPPRTPEQLERCRPLDIPPDEVGRLSEAEWYASAFRGDSPQLTLRAVATGSALGFLLALTNVYISLKVGFSIGVALTACVSSFTIWTSLVKARIARTPMTILENNCMQSTASSAGYATGAVVCSAVPALLMLSVTESNPRGTNLSWWIVAPWTFFVAALGVVMAVPMKRTLINRERLRFPSGTAAAALLHSLHSSGKEAVAKGRALFGAAAVGVLAPVLKDLALRDGEGLLPDRSKAFDWLPLRYARWLDPKTHDWVSRWTAASDWGLSLDHGVLLLGAGALVGLRTTLAMVAGSLTVAYGVAPRALSWAWINARGDLVTAAQLPQTASRDIGTWFGAPLLVGYGLMAFLLRPRLLGRAFASVSRRSSSQRDDPGERAEVPMRWFVVGGALASLGIVLVARTAFAVPLHYGALAVLMAFFMGLVVCRATGETDITLGGPMGKLVQLTYGVLMPQNYAANLATASITDGASLASADLLNDLKAGYLLGAHPRRQFVAQFLGIFTGTVATCVAYYTLIPDALALTGDADHTPAFAAPGAQMWRAVAELFRTGVGNLHPMARWGLVVGVVTGGGLSLLERVRPRLKSWIPSATGVGLGMLLPFQVAFSFLLGAVAAWIFRQASRARAERFSVPIASGLIAGESVAGVLVQVLNNVLS